MPWSSCYPPRSYPSMATQTASTVLMIEPVSFGYNPETAVNNYFQAKPSDVLEDSVFQIRAFKEFSDMVKVLRDAGVQVIVVQDTPRPRKPDSIFPNNWFSTHEDGRVVLYPMFAPNRRQERRLDVLEKLRQERFLVDQVKDYSTAEKEAKFLEGTGSMVFDRVNKIAYAALSARTNETLLDEFCSDFGYRSVPFRASQWAGNERVPVYHTNVMLCITKDSAIVCLECIDDTTERETVKQNLILSGKTIVTITESQMKHFTGNMLQVSGTDAALYLIMSETAKASLTPEQLKGLESTNTILSVSLDCIEKYGGGSARCMIAEIFLPAIVG